MSAPAPTSPSAPKAAAAAPPTPRGKDWADEDDSDSDDELRKQFGMDKVNGAGGAAAPAGLRENAREKSPEPQPNDKPVASLLSRIGGLATSDDETSAPSSSSPRKAAQFSSTIPSSASAPRERPKANISNPLFGRALASATSSRQQPSTSTSSPSPAPVPAAPSGPPKEEKISSAAPPKTNPVQAKAESSARSAVDDSQKGKELFPTEEKKQGAMTAVADSGWGGAPVRGDGWGNAPQQQGQPSSNNNAGDDIGWDPAPADNEDGGDAGGLIANEFEVELKLADMQADPNSPLYSIKQFEALPIHPDLLKGIYSVGFKKPSKIQERALPMLLNNPPRNLIGQSQSGTGKTAAFALNMLSRVDPGVAAPQAVCLAPSRELARQIQEVVDSLGQFTDVKTMLAVPGSWSRTSRIDKQILIGTPGTLVDMLSRGGRIFDPKLIRVFVLDEADEMVALQGLGDQTTRIKKMLPPHVQNVLFSATFSDEVRQFAESFAPEANQMFLRKEEVTVDAIKQLYLVSDGEEQKYNALAALYDCMSIGQSIVFCRRRETADRIADRLTQEGHSVASLHGDKMTSERDGILDGFRNGKTKVLITTNVIARGIDILQVNMVVNYDVPDMGPEGGFRPDIETYIHRIGRTGRFGRKGCSVTFVHDQRSNDDVQEIMRILGKPMKRIDATSRTDLDDLEKALKLAMKGVEK